MVPFTTAADFGKNIGLPLVFSNESQGGTFQLLTRSDWKVSVVVIISLLHFLGIGIMVPLCLQWFMLSVVIL